MKSGLKVKSGVCLSASFFVAVSAAMKSGLKAVVQNVTVIAVNVAVSAAMKSGLKADFKFGHGPELP